jgi:hypothetical protein
VTDDHAWRIRARAERLGPRGVAERLGDAGAGDAGTSVTGFAVRGAVRPAAEHQAAGILGGSGSCYVTDSQSVRMQALNELDDLQLVARSRGRMASLRRNAGRGPSPAPDDRLIPGRTPAACIGTCW